MSKLREWSVDSKEMKPAKYERVFRPERRVAFALTMFALAVSRSLAGEQPSDLFVVGTSGGTVAVLDSGLDQIVADIPTKGRAPLDIEPAPDGNTLYVTTDGRAKIEVIDLKQKKAVDVIDLSSPDRSVKIYGLALNRKENRLYVHVRVTRHMPDEVQAEPPQIWAIDLPSRKVSKLLQVPWGIYALVFSPDERWLYAFGPDIYFIDPVQARIVRTIRLDTNTTPGQGTLSTSASVQYEQSGIFSMGGTRSDPITKKDFAELVNFDLETGEIDQMDLGPPTNLNSAVVSPDRKRAYALWDKLFVIDLEQRKVVAIRDLERTEGVANIARDGRKLYVSGQGPYIYVYDTNSLNLLKTIQLSGDVGSGVFRAVRSGAP